MPLEMHEQIAAAAFKASFAAFRRKLISESKTRKNAPLKPDDLFRLVKSAQSHTQVNHFANGNGSADTFRAAAQAWRDLLEGVTDCQYSELWGDEASEEVKTAKAAMIDACKAAGATVFMQPSNAASSENGSSQNPPRNSEPDLTPEYGNEESNKFFSFSEKLKNNAPDLAIFEIKNYQTNDPEVSGHQYSAAITLRECQDLIDGEVYKLSLKRFLLSAFFFEARPRLAPSTLPALSQDGKSSLSVSLDAQGIGSSTTAEFLVEVETEVENAPGKGIYADLPFLVVEGDFQPGDKVDLVCRPYDLLVDVIAGPRPTNSNAFRVAQKWLQNRLAASPLGAGRAVISTQYMAKFK